MLTIDISFKLNDIDFNFKTEVKRGEVYTFNAGEPILADKLFWVLCGLDKNYEGEVKGEGICFNPSTFNNVLALGDKTMFIRGSVERNIYKALRVRAKPKIAKVRTQEVIELYKLKKLAKLNIKLLEDGELMTVALARAHFRQIGLVVLKKLQDTQIDFTKFGDAYIIIIT